MAATGCASPLPDVIHSPELCADTDDVGFASPVGRFRPFLWRGKKVSVLTPDASNAVGVHAAATAMHRLGLGSSPETLHVYGITENADGQWGIVTERINHGCPGRLFAVSAPTAAFSLSEFLGFKPPPPARDALAFVSLQEVLDQNQTSPLPRRARLSLSLALAEAVASLHVRGIVHGAMNPANILVAAAADDRIMVKLIDVGARPRTAYSDPECSTHATVAADVYALGALVAHLYVSGMSLEVKAPADLIRFVQLGNRRALLARQCPVWLSLLVAKCMNSDATKRPSIDYVVACLGESTEKVKKLQTVRVLAPHELGPMTHLLGSGSNGAVYRSLLDGRDVAVKVLSPATTKEIFEHEVWLLAELGTSIHTVELVGTSVLPVPSHPKLVTRCIVMEFMAGGSLQERLYGGTLTLGEVITIALEIAGALASFHERNIIHRDIKPANILFDAHGHVKVADFGVGCKVTGRTMTTRTGTYEYMAPEVFDTDDYTAAADMYSFGVLLTTLLEPFADGPPGLLALARQCMQRDPRERPTAGAAARVLQPLVWTVAPLPIIPLQLLQIVGSPVGHPIAYLYLGASVVLEPAPRGHSAQQLVLDAYRHNSEHTVHLLGLVLELPTPMVVVEATTRLRPFLQRTSCHVMALVRAITEALAALHARKAVVAHLVPNAIAVDGNGRVKVKSCGVDTTGAALYMAPEVAAGAPTTFASNVYSLGKLWATLWHLRGETCSSYPPGSANS
ncbi:serine/threonine protein kinase [Saprolegnia diclina VS20]|uniref:Serine/threonine protein kinase n=1 Tax=Saprolegnia diclina (strain VS20) TaxID=1156394 RepID=T0R5T5_SAPDV|nr:serine/threonine protein kinase [Saprolegnia diclina VS20]EQC42301.1 serine/threonine protein kinase [Saprolegnia diclina VS20]|eukprot:XP_008603724.1 serine/threonine protein kinase [Saprolegnia diclina VS20]